MLTRRFLMLAAVAGIGLSANDGATAQPYPSKVIKLIVPFGAGSQPDTIARLIGQQLSSRVGPVVVENRPGAGGISERRQRPAQPPDGHTLVLGTIGSLAIGPALLKSPGYDALKSFAPVAMVSNAPFVLVVGPDVPAKTVSRACRPCEGQSGQTEFRRCERIASAPGMRPVPACDRDRHRSCAIQGRTKHCRSAGRADSDAVRGHDCPASAHSIRKGKAPRGDGS